MNESSVTFNNKVWRAIRRAMDDAGHGPADRASEWVKELRIGPDAIQLLAKGGYVDEGALVFGEEIRVRRYKHNRAPAVVVRRRPRQKARKFVLAPGGLVFSVPRPMELLWRIK